MSSIPCANRIMAWAGADIKAVLGPSNHLGLLLRPLHSHVRLTLKTAEKKRGEPRTRSHHMQRQGPSASRPHGLLQSLLPSLRSTSENLSDFQCGNLPSLVCCNRSSSKKPPVIDLVHTSMWELHLSLSFCSCLEEWTISSDNRIMLPHCSADRLPPKRLCASPSHRQSRPSSTRRIPQSPQLQT